MLSDKQKSILKDLVDLVDERDPKLPKEAFSLMEIVAKAESHVNLFGKRKVNEHEKTEYR